MMYHFDWLWDKKLNILRVVTTGSVTKETIFDYYQTIINDTTLPRDLKILVNPSQGNYTGKVKDVPFLISKLKDTMKYFNSLQEAIVVTTPFNTVVATLFSRSINIPDYRFKIFSTEEAAIEWLNG